jgi:hypothetical protein
MPRVTFGLAAEIQRRSLDVVPLGAADLRSGVSSEIATELINCVDVEVLYSPVRTCLFGRQRALFRARFNLYRRMMNAKADIEMVQGFH